MNIKYKNLFFKFIIVAFLSYIFILIYIKFFINQNIIEKKEYDQFDKIKSRYIKNDFIRPYLEQITILNYLYSKKVKNKNHIHICMSLNDRYIYPILVSIESILINCNKDKTFITFHILCSPDVKQITLSKFKYLFNRYSSNLEVIFYGMGNNFSNRNDKRLSQVTFYRLFIPIIINVDKIIYLDGDTLAFQDLTEMYQTPFNDNYILGFLGIQSFGIDYLGIKSKKYINTGVLLLNLKKIRKDNKCIYLLKIAYSNIKLMHNDNTLLNFIFYPKIGRLPLKFGIWNFGNIKDIEIYSKKIRQKINITEHEEVLKEPGLIHHVLCWPKPWSFKSMYSRRFTSCKSKRKCKCTKYHNLWYSYAKNNYYYKDILNFTGENKRVLKM